MLSTGLHFASESTRGPGGRRLGGKIEAVFPVVGRPTLLRATGFPGSAFLDGKERSREMGKSRLGLERLNGGAPARKRRSRCRTCGHSGGQVKIQDMAV